MAAVIQFCDVCAFLLKKYDHMYMDDVFWNKLLHNYLTRPEYSGYKFCAEQMILQHLQESSYKDIQLIYLQQHENWVNSECCSEESYTRNLLKSYKLKMRNMILHACAKIIGLLLHGTSLASKNIGIIFQRNVIPLNKEYEYN